MFQTEVILLFQSLASDFWTGFFNFWTEIGYARWVVPPILLIMFGVSLRAGFILLHAVFWNGMVTFYLKEWFSLPRPCNVDRNVQLLDKGGPNPTVFEKQGARSFFGRLPADVVDSIRANPIDSWGMPSGHTSNAVTLWGLISLVYEKTWARVLAGCMLIFIPLSRIYLGRHFLADVLAGYALGLVFVILFYHGVYKGMWFKRFFESSWAQTTWNLTTWLLLIYLLGVPLGLLLFPGFNPQAVGAFLGLNLGYLLLKFGGVPKDSATPWKRAARVLVVAVFYLGLEGLGRGLQSLFSIPSSSTWNFARAVLTMTLLMWGATQLCIRLGFFKRPK